MARNSDDRLAVLIDADNAQPTLADALMAEIATLGVVTVKRAYGNWTTTQLTGWKDAVNRHAIQPMQQFAYTTGKNATDSALIIDAMDLLYADRLEGFVLVSSDSDFTRLASRLRESGMTVYGIGDRKTPEAFRVACNRFIFTDVLGVKDDEDEAAASKDGGGTAAPAPSAKKIPTKKLRGDAKLMRLLRNAVAVCSDDNDWANLSQVGSTIAKQEPEFDSRNWGYAKLIELVVATEDFEVDRETRGSGGSVRVRRLKG